MTDIGDWKDVPSKQRGLLPRRQRQRRTRWYARRRRQNLRVRLLLGPDRRLCFKRGCSCRITRVHSPGIANDQYLSLEPERNVRDKTATVLFPSCATQALIRKALSRNSVIIHPWFPYLSGGGPSSRGGGIPTFCMR